MRDLVPFLIAWLAIAATAGCAGQFLKYWNRRRAFWLMEFMRELENFLPPAKGRHHKLRYAEYGSDQEGWEPQLGLELQLSSGPETFFLTNKDLRKTPRKAARRVGQDILIELRGPANAAS